LSISRIMPMGMNLDAVDFGLPAMTRRADWQQHFKTTFEF
jgi:hypothetical protein